ncbi:MAG TPA: glycosyltransferase [Solirubrobacterales bacterium]|nr:glycosyltransferase [Solirubrobacterales bacterium]
MARPELIQIPPQPLDRYRDLLGEEYPSFEAVAERAREEFAGRAIWHVNSTARGGGVAEILHALLPYVRGVGVDTRWVVLHEEPEFFTVTKRLHNNLHDDPGDGGSLGEGERRLYETALGASAAQLAQLIQPDDVVYLHDPQTAGLVPAMKGNGVKVVWRCHVGVDRPGRLARGGWDFLRSFVEGADAYVFSREEYIWDGLEREKVWLMPPAIDPFSPKNQDLDRGTVEAILGEVGLSASAPRSAPTFVRGDGTPGRVERAAELLQEAPLPAEAKLVVQVSRWDRLKDPRGLLECFARHLEDPAVHLALVGPASGAVSDDPEGVAVYGDVTESWRRLPAETHRRVHLVNLPMDDLDENAAMVNAIQRRADVIVQKSIAEGFGLTVAEAMWKERPVVASRVGGIQDQIVDGESGVLIDDPHDLEAFATAFRDLIADPDRARRLGEGARARVRNRFLAVGRLREYVELVASLVDGDS